MPRVRFGGRRDSTLVTLAGCETRPLSLYYCTPRVPVSPGVRRAELAPHQITPPSQLGVFAGGAGRERSRIGGQFALPESRPLRAGEGKVMHGTAVFLFVCSGRHAGE